MNREKTVIIAFRVPPAVKERIQEESRKRDESLTHFMLEIIVAGWRSVVKSVVKQDESVEQ